MALITVRFYGSLKSFGSQFQLDVKDTAEAVRALVSQFPALRRNFQQGWYKVRIGRQTISPDTLKQGLFYQLKAGMILHFTPIVAGAKAAFQIIAGAALIATSFIPGLNVTVASVMLSLGASLALGGVSQLLTKTPQMQNPSENEKKQSTAFGHIQNMAAQGQPVPLAYGQIRCGSMIISQGIETTDLLEA